MDDLTRFARRLVEQLSTGSDGVHRAVAVGVIREKLLPYRVHRRALQLESVEDYETVLLRLVAGERGFVKTQPASAAQRCQQELAGTNPDLEVLDEVADATIQFTSLAAAQVVGDDGAETGAAAPREDTSIMASEAKPSGRTGEIAVAPPPPPPRDDKPGAHVMASEAKPSRRTAEIATAPAAPRDDSSCPQCTRAIPAGRKVVFCPWCGQRLIPFACPRCQTELESGWQHCITCGAPVKDPHHFE